jgi:hypothetical protein
MRRSLIGLLTLVAIAGLVTTSCQREATLRVTSINGGNELRSDLTDYYIYFDKVDSSNVILQQVNADSVKVELQYVEIGAGLPTWTPYEALLNQATVTFKSKLTVDQPVTYQKLVIPLTMAVPADASGKSKVTFWLAAIPAAWKQLVFADFASVEDPNQIDVTDLTEATVTFSGYDSVANRSVSASGKFEVTFGNFFDDPTKFGR